MGFEVILDFQKYHKNITVSYIHPASPYVSILRNYRPFIKTKKKKN